MRRSQYFIPTLKENPAEAQVISHRLMLRAGMVRQLVSGMYSWLPLGLKVLRKVENIIREEMNKAGALEILMPMVQPCELWQETERWDKYGKELLRIKDRHDNDFLLGPTHEEVVTDIYRKNIRSYKDLPVNLYQIQTKFRDEMRPRFGIMRAREFMMKDAYSFDINKEESLKSYDKTFAVYVAIFNRLGLQWRSVVADTGSIGGNYSHEFHVLADTGEDDLLFDTDSDYAVNVEKYDEKTAPKRKEELEQKKGIEVGHCFHLGNIYSKPMNATVTLDNGEDDFVMMGCYGIGVSRIVAAAIEQGNDEKGIIWPASMAPFTVGLINLRAGDEACVKASDDLYAALQAKNIETLYDDRDISAGGKFADMDLIGVPYQVIIGPRGLKDGMFEWKNRATGKIENLPIGEFPEDITFD